MAQPQLCLRRWHSQGHSHCSPGATRNAPISCFTPGSGPETAEPRLRRVCCPHPRVRGRSCLGVPDSVPDRVCHRHSRLSSLNRVPGPLFPPVPPARRRALSSLSPCSATFGHAHQTVASAGHALCARGGSRPPALRGVGVHCHSLGRLVPGRHSDGRLSHGRLLLFLPEDRHFGCFSF